jgi:LPS-assembly lipoprotein
MWSLEQAGGRRRGIRLTGALLMAALVAGCFQPLYGEHSLTGGPGVREALSSVKVLQIKAPNGTDAARLAVETRNQLIFDLTGGAGESAPTHELTLVLTMTRQGIIVSGNLVTNTEIVALDASYSLKELASGKTVVTGATFARSSYDVPSAAQRFVRVRGLRDAENRAAKDIADQIRDRLASYFVAGT